MQRETTPLRLIQRFHMQRPSQVRVTFGVGDVLYPRQDDHGDCPGAAEFREKVVETVNNLTGLTEAYKQLLFDDTTIVLHEPRAVQYRARPVKRFSCDSPVQKGGGANLPEGVGEAWPPHHLPLQVMAMMSALKKRMCVSVSGRCRR